MNPTEFSPSQIQGSSVARKLEDKATKGDGIGRRNPGAPGGSVSSGPSLRPFYLPGGVSYGDKYSAHGEARMEEGVQGREKETKRDTNSQTAPQSQRQRQGETEILIERDPETQSRRNEETQTELLRDAETQPGRDLEDGDTRKPLDPPLFQRQGFSKPPSLTVLPLHPTQPGLSSIPQPLSPPPWGWSEPGTLLALRHCSLIIIIINNNKKNHAKWRGDGCGSRGSFCLHVRPWNPERASPTQARRAGSWGARG